MSTLEQWRFEADGGDWADVLRRAGSQKSPRRRRAPRAAILGAAALLAVAAPAVAIVTVKLGGGHAGGPRLAANLHGPDGASGTFVVTAPRVWLTRSRAGLRVPWIMLRDRRFLSRRGTLELNWALELRGTAGSVSSVRIERAHTPAITLCSPCQSATGHTRIPLSRAATAFNGRPTVEVVDGSQTLRGPLVLKLRKR